MEKTLGKRILQDIETESLEEVSVLLHLLSWLHLSSFTRHTDRSPLIDKLLN
jgi:hypothetical protein